MVIGYWRVGNYICYSHIFLVCRQVLTYIGSFWINGSPWTNVKKKLKIVIIIDNIFFLIELSIIFKKKIKTHVSYIFVA
jgi:hypothetical protein